MVEEVCAGQRIAEDRDTVVRETVIMQIGDDIAVVVVEVVHDESNQRTVDLAPQLFSLAGSWVVG